MRYLVLAVLAAAIFAAEDEAPKPPEYAKDLCAMADAWIVADQARDPEDKAKKPTGDALEAKRKEAWAAFIAHADFKPITKEDVVRLRGPERLQPEDEAYELNQWMVRVKKDYGLVAGGMGPLLYAEYKHAPWVLYLGHDHSPVQEKSLADSISKPAKAQATATAGRAR